MGKGDIIAAIEAEQLKSDIPDFRPGDTLRVHVKVVEGEKERIQVFEGVCLRRKHGGVRETFTARKVSYSVGVERTFPMHSPRIDKIEVLTRGKVRRAKLYYLRARRGKRARVRERRWWLDAKENQTAAAADAAADVDAPGVSVEAEASPDASPAEANADASRE